MNGRRLVFDGSSGDCPPAKIARTGYGNAEERQRAAQSGFDHHLLKPVEFEQLEQVLASIEQAASGRRVSHRL